MENRVLIFTEGGSKQGYGHIVRCVALYEELEEKGMNVEFIIDGDDGVKDVLGEKNYRIMNWYNEENIKGIIKRTDRIIIDSYIANLEIYKYISKKVSKVLYIDDNKRLDYPKGIVLNPSIYGENLDYPKTMGRKYLLGSDYPILRKEFRAVKLRERKDGIKDVLIVLGGSDIKDLSLEIIKKVQEIDKNIKTHLVIGSGFKNIEKIKKEANKNTEFYYNLNAKEMRDLMLKSDFAITAAGQTIYELLRTKTNFVAIKVAQNQNNNIKSLEKIGIKTYEYNEIDKLELVVRDIGEIVDGKGVSRIVRYFLSDYKIRKAEEKDIKKVFELSNEDYVREQSLNKSKIKWQEHIKWYEKEIKNSESAFYIIEGKKDEFYGQIRFNIEKEDTLLSISFHKNIRSKGLARFVLNECIDIFLEERKDIKRLRAVIKEENLASIKIFEKNGFIFSGKDKEENCYEKNIYNC